MRPAIQVGLGLFIAGLRWQTATMSMLFLSLFLLQATSVNLGAGAQGEDARENDVVIPARETSGKSSGGENSDKSAARVALEKAKAEQVQLRPQQALETLDAALASGGLTRIETLSSWALKAEVLAQLGEGQAAEVAFRTVLRIDRDYALNDDVADDARGPFAAALATRPNVGQGFSVDISARTVGEKTGFEVLLEADDQGAIAGCGVVGTSKIFKLSQETPIAFIELPGREAGREAGRKTEGEAAKRKVADGKIRNKRGLRIAVVDVQGNTWAVLRAPQAEETQVHWLTVSGAATTFVGLGAASALAIGYTAMVGKDDALATGLLVGVGAASVVAGIGAALVITDEVLKRGVTED